MATASSLTEWESVHFSRFSCLRFKGISRGRHFWARLKVRVPKAKQSRPLSFEGIKDPEEAETMSCAMWKLIWFTTITPESCAVLFMGGEKRTLNAGAAEIYVNLKVFLWLCIQSFSYISGDASNAQRPELWSTWSFPLWGTPWIWYWWT